MHSNYSLNMLAAEEVRAQWRSSAASSAQQRHGKEESTGFHEHWKHEHEQQQHEQVNAIRWW